MSKITYTAPERESHFNCNDEDNIWKGFVLQSKVITKLRNVGVEPTYIREEDGAQFYELDFNQVSFRSGKKRLVSDEQKQAASDRFKKMHEEKKKSEEAHKNNG